MSWAQDGLDNLPPHNHWSLLILDCGDGADTFILTDCCIAPQVRYESFEKTVRAEVVRYGEDFPVSLENGKEPIRVAEHNIRELKHSILSSYHPPSTWEGYNHDLLWLAVATFALRETLHNVQFCQRILKGRQKIMLMSGYEEIFFYLGVVTDQGLRF